MVKLCKHFKKFPRGIHEELVMSDGHSWNAWHKAYSGGQLIYSSFVTGGYLAYLDHLLGNKGCRRVAGMKLKDVKELVEKIEEEWRQVTDP